MSRSSVDRQKARKAGEWPQPRRRAVVSGPGRCWSIRRQAGEATRACREAPAHAAPSCHCRKPGGMGDTGKTKSRIRPEGWTGDSEGALEEDLPPVRIVGSPPRAHNRVPHSHHVFGPLNPWLNGPPHGVEPRSLPSDVDECGFRFNRRQRPMAALQTLRGISLQKKPLTPENLRG
jgi:hypothetical protein